jgi:hypothetical protein
LAFRNFSVTPLFVAADFGCDADVRSPLQKREKALKNFLALTQGMC